MRVLEIEPENHRLSLGLKQLTDDPWSTVLTRFKVGDKVQGKVSFVANYGAFVELGQGNVDFPAVFAALEKVNFKGWGVIELDAVPDKSRTPLQCGEITKAYLKDKMKMAI